jgi:hypothetical protein
MGFRKISFLVLLALVSTRSFAGEAKKAEKTAPISPYRAYAESLAKMSDAELTIELSKKQSEKSSSCIKEKAARALKVGAAGIGTGIEGLATGGFAILNTLPMGGIVPNFLMSALGPKEIIQDSRLSDTVANSFSGVWGGIVGSFFFTEKGQKGIYAATRGAALKTKQAALLTQEYWDQLSLSGPKCVNAGIQLAIAASVSRARRYEAPAVAVNNSQAPKAQSPVIVAELGSKAFKPGTAR